MLPAKLKPNAQASGGAMLDAREPVRDVKA